MSILRLFLKRGIYKSILRYLLKYKIKWVFKLWHKAEDRNEFLPFYWIRSILRSTKYSLAVQVNLLVAQIQLQSNNHGKIIWNSL